MAPDDDVVADLHLVVDLGALPYDCVAIGAAVDGGARPDLDIVLDDDAADLRDLEVTARAHGETEAVLADMDAGMDDDPVANRGVLQGRAGADRGVPADPNIGPDHRVGSEDRAGADFRPRPDYRARIDGHAVFEPRLGMNERARRYARRAEHRARPRRVGVEGQRDLGEAAIGFLGDEQRNVRAALATNFGAIRIRPAGVASSNGR